MQVSFFRVIHVIAIFVLWSVLGMAYASTPNQKKITTQEDFEAGELTGISIHPYGQITLAPRRDLIFESELSAIWACVSDSKERVYVAGGNSGKVFRVTAKGQSELVFEAPEVQIYAMTFDRKGNLYVGSSPQGKIYKIPAGDAISPDTAVFFDPQELYIWSLAMDADDNLFVATGETGNIYKVSPNGKGTVFYQADDTHVRKIVFDGHGNLLAGTANKGLVLRIDSHGKSFVLFDSPLVEISDIIEDSDGNVYAAAIGKSRLQIGPRPPTGAEAIGTKSDQNPQDNQVEVDLVLQQASAAISGAGSQTGEVYRIDRKGNVRTFQTLKSEGVLSLALSRQGDLLLGAGNEGRLYSMNRTGDMTLLTNVDALQITFLGRTAAGRLLLASSSAGSLYHLNEDLNKQGSFVSEVVDAGVPSMWGSVSWESSDNGNSKVVVQTRSGNTSEPDKTWSDWSQPVTKSTGQGITSPTARFLQVKATLSGTGGKDTPRLNSLSFSYLNRNTPPRIKQVRIHAPAEYYPESSGRTKSDNIFRMQSDEGANDFKSQSLGRKSNRKGLRSVSWVVEDENGDQMSFSAYYKGIDNSEWKTLFEDYIGGVYSWDSELMPDGKYQIKLVAKDDLSNPPDLALTSESVSQPFVVDNTGPRVSDITLQRDGPKTILSFSVRDDLNQVKSVDVGLNAEAWRLVYPDDGICDAKVETFTIEISEHSVREAEIVVKAVDAVDNVGFGKKTMKR